ncbi:MAG: PQQ-binding-like beta-propeller repeat protein [Armatimonadetes bacterium]|nr:PQQ-binding-like beta-propeller repeat protein [Armatimonadota bacterium]
MKRNALLATSLIALSVGALITRAADWPYWGGGASRNMVSSETNTPTTWDPGRYKGSTEEIDLATTKNVKWVAKLGSQSYGNPTISGGKIFVGTNNESPRDEKLKGDRAVLLCLDEKTGELVWQLAIPKLGTGKVSDWEFLGLCSSPAVDGDKVYVVTNRCEVICLDVNGQANGNQGVQDEAKYLTDKGKPLHTLGAKDADVLWRYDMREELGVFPHNITNCGPLIVGNTVTVTTSNGVDWTHTNIPNPKAPALCVLDKNTGKYLGEENSGVSAKTLHSNWSSPAGGQVNGKDTIIFGGGDGNCYAFDAASAVGGEQSDLKTLWKLDCNPPEYRVKNGKPLKYATFDGPSEVIATPVLYKNRVYVPIGQDPEHGEGIGQMLCIDAVTGKTIWANKGIQRSLSTPSIINGLVFVADYSGFIRCFDAETGKSYWSFDTKSHIWGSTLVADGKVYVGTEDGDIVVLAADKVMKEVGRVDMRAPVYASPVLANGTLYVGTPTHLYAIATGAKAAQAAPKPNATALARMEARAKQLRAEHEKLASCEAHGTP